MKKLKTYPLRLDKKYMFLLVIFFLILSCNKKGVEKNNISVSLVKKEKLDKNSLILTILVKNTSNTNYALSIFPEYYLVKTKKGFIYFDDIGKIKGKIVSSDFADEENCKNIPDILTSFYKKTGYNYKEADEHLFSFAMHDYEAYASYILFLPRKTERRMIICFNSNKINNETLFDKNTRISADWEFYKPRAKVLDSLLKSEKIDYKVYDRDLILKDSLFINK